jgi:hypothetical protein
LVSTPFVEGAELDKVGLESVVYAGGAVGTASILSDVGIGSRRGSGFGGADMMFFFY